MQRKVQVWIFSDSKCLLLKTNQARGSFWQPVTGSVEDGEAVEDGALREAVEETGFRFPQTPQDTQYEFEFESRFGGTARERVFAVAAPAGCPSPTLDPKEHQAFQWITPESALTEIKFPSAIEGLKRAMATAFGRALLVALIFFANILSLTPLAHAAQDALVVSESTAIRSAPESSATILEVHKPGDGLRVSSETKDGWFKTRTSEGQIGWVHQGDVSPGAFDSTLKYGDIDRKPRQNHIRREDIHPTLAFKVGIGPTILIPTDLNKTLGSSMLKTYDGISFMGQVSYFLKNDLRLFLRLEHLSATGHTLSYQLDFSGNLTSFGVEFDIATNARWRTFWGLMGGMGLGDSVTITATDRTTMPNSSSISGMPLSAALSLGAQYSLFSWLAISGEAGFRLAQSLSGSTSSAFTGDVPYFSDGQLMTPVKITETGPFVFLGVELTF